MLFKDFIKKDFDMDIVSDYTDDIYVAFVGPAYKFTSIGREKFKPLFDVEIDVEPDNSIAILKLNKYEDSHAEYLTLLASTYFNCQAGYLPEGIFLKYFKEDSYRP